MRLDGRVVAVTGGAGGIGLETSRHLAGLGGSVILIDLDRRAVDASAEELVAGGARALGVAADTTSAAAMAAALATAVERFGRLDGLVTSAGIRMRSTAVVDLDDGTWDRVLAVNLRGAFVACREAARRMLGTGGGAIVNVASISGKTPRMGQSAYCVSKAGVIQLTRVLALELAQHGIRVNAVCPGTTATPLFKQAMAAEGERTLHERIYGSSARFRPGIPLRRISEPAEQAAAIAFLLSASASHITGQALFVDGGESIV